MALTDWGDTMSTGGLPVLEITGGGTLSDELIRAVNEFCDRVEDASDDVLAIVQLGNGEPGGEQWPGEIDIHRVNRWERALRRMERLRAVTIAVAEGHCGNPAVEVLMVADHRIAANDAQLALPTGAGRFWPGMVLYRLANQIGVARTRRLLISDPVISAAKAAEFGLVDETAVNLPAALDTAVAALGSVDAAEFAIRRRLLLDATTTSFEDALGVHLAASDRTLRRAADERPVHVGR
ncbi:enoyl-CoA hydratase/isomerase family protein [Saccharopolyspora indica]|uniref:enoyl-CoA-hydratase DpgB n=1 Tax=Saccharopolyspora indica TaxID=1229659 RepID=UPI0022EA2D93|nr:enoyl-CoA-hydratase DpgB [Saccharopolyspora indica]MDA3647916.1 enoyl-CoA hydratase/isomerase family protein [Saccharopolyspora indica]